MSAPVLKLSNDGRRLYETRRTCSRQGESVAVKGSSKRRVYVDGTCLRRANSAYVERPERLRADELY